MEGFLSVLGGLIAFAGTYWLGRRIGVSSRKMKPWLVRAAYPPGVIAGTIVCALGALRGQTWLWAVGLCLMGGSLVGLRHGRKLADDERRAALWSEREPAERGIAQPTALEREVRDVRALDGGAGEA